MGEALDDILAILKKMGVLNELGPVIEDLTGKEGRGFIPEIVGEALKSLGPRITSDPLEEMLKELSPDMRNALESMQARLQESVGATIAKVITGVVANAAFVAEKAPWGVGIVLGSIKAFVRKGEIAVYEGITGSEGIQPEPLNPRELTPLVFRGSLSVEEYLKEAKRNGISEERAWLLLAAAQPIATEPSVMAGLVRGVITESAARQKLTELGYDDDDIALFFKIRYTQASSQHHIALWLREEITESELDGRLAELGFIEREIAGLKTLAFFVPPPQDLIRFAVREAFSPEQVKRFTLDEDFPEEFAKFAAWQGISKEWAQKYWIAHWRNPSPNQVFEMLHRRVIDEDIVSQYLKLEDYAPFWRDKMKAISFLPLTRIDVRRMFRLGVLDRQGVFNAYLDIGYSAENAERLTRFVEIDNALSLIGGVQSALKTMFRKGIISEAELRQFLLSMGLTPEFVELIIQQETFLKQAQWDNRRVEATRASYFKGIITLSEAGLRLAGFGIPPENIPLMLGTWELEKEARVTRIQLRDLHSAFQQKIISEEEYRAELSERNIRKKDIDVLVKLKGGINTEDDQSVPPPEPEETSPFVSGLPEEE